MIITTHQERGTETERVPAELVELKERLSAHPPAVRADLEPLIDDALENAKFRGRAMVLARDALERFRLDLTVLSFDLEITRQEREALREQLERS